MSVSSETAAPAAASPRAARRVGGLRRAGFVTFVLLVAQFALGMYVNLYVDVPKADSGQMLDKAISNGPVELTAHIALGVLLILAGLGFLVQSILAKRAALIVTAALGLITIVGAAASGGSFVTGDGSNRDSMTMAALSAVALLSYGAALFLLSRPAAGGQGD